MAASMASAIRERIINGKNTGLIIFGIALVVTAALLTYTKISYGYPY